MFIYYFVTLTGCRQVLLMVYCVKVFFVFHVSKSDVLLVLDQDKYGVLIKYIKTQKKMWFVSCYIFSMDRNEMP